MCEQKKKEYIPYAFLFVYKKIRISKKFKTFNKYNLIMVNRRKILKIPKYWKFYKL